MAPKDNGTKFGVGMLLVSFATEIGYFEILVKHFCRLGSFVRALWEISLLFRTAKEREREREREREKIHRCIDRSIYADVLK